MSEVPPLRIRACNTAAVRPEGDYVLYWMVAYRRTRWNFALQRAVEWARRLDRPLVIFEALRCGYRWASDRLHRFVLDGMAENAERMRGLPALYYAYVEDEPGAGSGLLEALGERAGVVVTDDFPAFFLPRMLSAAGSRLTPRLEAVDSNGLLPIRATDRAFPTAFAFRRFLQRELRSHLGGMPSADPLGSASLQALDSLPSRITRGWPDASRELPARSARLEPGALPIDHSVEPAPIAGGWKAARAALDRFIAGALSSYGEDRAHPDVQGSTGLSPYLHFGHISSHEVFDALMREEEWDIDRLASDAAGRRSGWWGVSENVEALLDQLITWRELGFNMCAHREDYDRYESLPAWALATLEAHAADDRPYIYTPGELERARTHDEVWNAAQNQLRREGGIHNYLRMLWGKKILEWTGHPRDALEIMIELNNKYALDGRDPNSYSGILWCLGRYDRPWGPERPIFGKVRYMSSENTRRKLRISEYLERYGARSEYDSR